MATNYVNLVGKARFIRHLFQPDDAFGASKFKAGIWLDDENLQKFQDSGIQVNVKEDETGKYVVLSRDEVKMIDKNLVYFTPPYVKNKDTSYKISYVDSEGNVVRQYQDPNKKNDVKMVGETFLIGNGSLVELNVCVFDTRYKGKGHRLEGIRILDLIEYKPQPKEDTTGSLEDSVPFEAEPEVVEKKAGPKKKKAF